MRAKGTGHEHTVGVSQLCSEIYLLCYAALLKKSTYYAQKCAYYAQRFTWCSSIFNVKTWQSWTLEPVCGGGFTRIFRFRMSSDCGWARSLHVLRRDGTAELVAWKLVQVSLPSLRLLHVVFVAGAIVNHYVVRHVCAPPWNDVIFSQNLPTGGGIMLALCSMLSCAYYAHFSAGIISTPLTHSNI